MKRPYRIRRLGLHFPLLAGLLTVLIALLAQPIAAHAHPLDVYLQATYITVAPTEIVVELDISPGVLVAPPVLEQLDSDGDQAISDAEGQAYAETILPKLELLVNGEPRVLAITRIDIPAYITIQAGYGTIRVYTAATLPDGMTGTHQIAYTNTHAPTGAAYQVNTFVAKDAAITLGKQNRDDGQQSITVDFTLGGTTQASTEPADETTEATAVVAEAAAGEATSVTQPPASEQGRQLLGYLQASVLSPWLVLVALVLASVLGGLHALTPGHGKTLVAAYLVGSRGTIKHAVALGTIVTFTHTVSVILIGILALFASQYIVPSMLAPLLTVTSGLLVVFMGIRLILQRWTIVIRGRIVHHTPEHGHAHTSTAQHAHDHAHNHTDAFTHDHGDGRTHTHRPPIGGVRLGNLVALGVSGGLVPCPEALGIMVIAIGVNRILLGLGLIVSFSFGLAAVLIAIGILLVRSRTLLERLGGLGSRWNTILPLVSAVLVTALGAGITLSGLIAYLG